jgi:hypothetical protein
MRDNWNIALNRQTKRQTARPAYVSLNRRGEIAMNDKAFKMIGCPYNVAILYLPPQPSADNSSPAGGELKGVIGVKYPVTEDRDFFPVRRYGRGGRMRIIRAAFALKQFGISIDETLKFYNPPLVYYRNQPMLLLELSRSPPA